MSLEIFSYLVKDKRDWNTKEWAGFLQAIYEDVISNNEILKIKNRVAYDYRDLTREEYNRIINIIIDIYDTNNIDTTKIKLLLDIQHNYFSLITGNKLLDILLSNTNIISSWVLSTGYWNNSKFWDNLAFYRNTP